MPPKQRDWVAAIIVVTLGRIAYTYNSGSESLIVSVTLAFYTNFEAKSNNSKAHVIHTAKPVPFDIDGDGIIEALIVPSTLAAENTGDITKPHQWVLKVLDLKPMHSLKSKWPFNPVTLFSSAPILNDDQQIQRRVPIRIITGQVSFKNIQIGVPSIVTVWNDGTITMHSVTAEPPAKEPIRKVEDHIQPKLELREMWRINPFINSERGKKDDGTLEEKTIDFEELDIMLDTDTQIGEHVAVIIAARYWSSETWQSNSNNNDELGEETKHPRIVASYYAIDACSGNIIWTHEGKTAEDIDKSRTMKKKGNHVNVKSEPISDNIGSEECLRSYRDWIMHPLSKALPYMSWDPKFERGILVEDSKLFISPHYRTNELLEDSEIDAFSNTENLVLFHNRNGVDVLSLKNGAHLCHLSLFPSGLYVDINNDGIIDHLQFVSDRRLQESKRDDNLNIIISENHLCHALLLSGIPPREELFSIPLCKGDKLSLGGTIESIHAAPPLLVEAYDDNIDHPRQDIVFALNTGIVKRYDSTGKEQWSVGPNVKRLPLWEDGERTSAFLGRINFEVAKSTRAFISSIKAPIIVVGSDAMSILSSGRGKILAHESFPLLSVDKPILSDMSGDGTTDILILSDNIVKGYHITVEQGGSPFIRTMFIFSIVGIAIAVLFQQCYHNDYRSTDEWKQKKT